MAPSSVPSPSKKLLITDPKPESDPHPASSSSTTSAPPAEKRTRDLPNLSDCHGCSRRINYTNPKDRLQPLDSVWRIVLLCRRCRVSIHSGQKCPYCFREAGNSGDLLTCRKCQRKIHRNCVRDYGNCTPWCYLGVGLEGFRVCVDCFVPESLKNTVKVLERSETEGGLKDNGEAVDLLENVVGDAKGGGEKVKRVLKAKENVLRMANGEMHYINLEDDASGLSAGNSNSIDVVEVVDGIELENSPRILRDKSLVNSDIGIWKDIYYKRSRFKKNFYEGLLLETGDNGAENERMNQHMENDPNIASGRLSIGLLTYKQDKRRKFWLLVSENAKLENLHLDDRWTSCLTKIGADTSADSVCVDTDPQNGDKFGPELVIYRRTRFKKKVCQTSDVLTISRDSSSCDSHGMAFESDHSQPGDTNLSTGSPAKSNINVILPSERCDRYQLKYFKRITITKPCSDFLHFSTFLCVNQVAATAVSNSEAGGSVDNGEVILPNGTCNEETDRYYLKYAKRMKSSKSGSSFEAGLQSDAFLNKIEISAAGLAMNCSAESRTVSNASGDSLTIGLP